MTVIINKPGFNLRETLTSLKRKIGIKGAELLRANTVDEAYDVLNPVAFKNLLINGDMRVNQRGSATYTNDSAYTLDRWKFGRYASNWVQGSQQSSGTTLPEFPYCFRIQNPAGETSTYTNEIHINQVLESVNSARLRGKPLTLSFWARVATTPGISNGVMASIYFGSGTDNYADYNYFASNSVFAVDRTFTLSTEWSRYSFTTVAPSSTNQVGVAISKLNNAATAVANDYIEVTGVQLEVGSAPTPFEHRPYATELALCQRYFQYVSQYIEYQIGATGTFASPRIPFAVPMRSAPTYTITSNSGSASITSPAFGTYSVNSVPMQYTFSFSNSSAGYIYYDIRGTASAEL